MLKTEVVSLCQKVEEINRGQQVIVHVGSGLKKVMSRARDSGPQASLNYCYYYWVSTSPQPWIQRITAPDVLATGTDTQS